MHLLVCFYKLYKYDMVNQANKSSFNRQCLFLNGRNQIRYIKHNKGIWFSEIFFKTCEKLLHELIFFHVDELKKTLLTSHDLSLKMLSYSSVSIFMYILLNQLHYEQAKKTKFLLAVIYVSPRRHSSISKTNKKIEKI